MKTAILTLPPTANYGGILQAYALQTVLERMGCEACVIDRRPQRLAWWLRPVAYTKRLFFRYVLGRKNVRLHLEDEVIAAADAVERLTRPFVQKHLLLRSVESLSDIAPGEFDAFVVGSDQVWRRGYFCGSFHTDVADAFLRFAKRWPVVRVAYAASFGTDEWEYSGAQTAECAALAARFAAVGVREDVAVDICRDRLGVEARHVLDPTMLLTAADYAPLFEGAPTTGQQVGEDGMLCYLLDASAQKQAVAHAAAERYGLVPFSVNNPHKPSLGSPLALCAQPPVEQWLRGFAGARFVVTDSFHACVFAILFRVPFAVVGNQKRGMSRFRSLLGMFGLENRMVDDADGVAALTDIDFDRVHAILCEKRRESLAFLQNSLFA